MAFADVITQDGIGWVWLIDVSLDNFATVAHRWSTFSCTVGSDAYQGRIPKGGLSKLTRGFGTDSLMRAGTVTVSLDNTDAAADWLVDRTTVASQVLRARFKLTLLVYPNGDFSSYQTKVCGTFKCLDFPMRDRERVTVQLADDTMGVLEHPLTTPTIREWAEDAGSTLDNCPLFTRWGAVPYVDWDTPLPLAFGEGKLNAWLASAAFNFEPAVAGSDDEAAVFASPMLAQRAIVVCVTTSPDDVSANDVQRLWGVYREDVTLRGAKWSGAESEVSIPKTFILTAEAIKARQIGSSVTPGTKTIWEPKRTQVITKDGASWRIIWVRFDVEMYVQWFATATVNGVVGGSQPDGSNAPVGLVAPQAPGGSGGASADLRAAAFSHFRAEGYPLSARTTPTAPRQVGVDVVRDLIVYYSKGGASAFDETRYAAAKQASPSEVSGVVLPQRSMNPRELTKWESKVGWPGSETLASGQLRQSLIDIAQSADLDIAMTWDGKIGIHSSYFTFANLTATRVALSETRETDVIERIPSKGERWSPYSRLFVFGPDGERYGPFDNPDATVSWGATLERTLQGKWKRFPRGASDPLYSDGVWESERRVESVVRPVVRFLADREALQLDLGDLFDFAWTRGGSAGPYTAAVFRVESITVDPETLATGIEAVWVDDITTVRPYLLDTEELTLRVRSTSGRTATVTDSNDVVEFSSGDIEADGVAAGDILVLEDATQAIDAFSRFRCLLIASVESTTEVRIQAASLDFDAPAGAAVDTWEIRRGAKTYPDSSSDPTNYPNDGLMYGKACDDLDDYSDGEPANVLL